MSSKRSIRKAFRFISIFLTILILTGCHQKQRLSVDSYLEFYTEICQSIGIDHEFEAVKEDGITVFMALGGLFNVGLAEDRNGDIIYASISTSMQYGKDLTNQSPHEEEFKKALLSAAYLLLPFSCTDFSVDENEIATIGGMILSSFEQRVPLGNWVISSEKTNSGFKIQVIFK